MTQVKINFWFILIRDCNDTGQNKFLVHIDQGLVVIIIFIIIIIACINNLSLLLIALFQN